jgi:hypothetical protein
MVGRDSVSVRVTNWLALGVGCQTCGREESWVDVTPQEDGGYQATLCATLPLSSHEQTYRYLQAPGMQVSRRQVHQAMAQSDSFWR